MTSTTVAAFAALDSLLADLDRLETENTALRTQLATTQAQRDTANAELTHHQRHYTTRTGW